MGEDGEAKKAYEVAVAAKLALQYIEGAEQALRLRI